MSTVTHASMLVLLTAMLGGVCACSDNDNADKVGQGPDAVVGGMLAKPSSDASQAAKSDAALKDIALAAQVEAEILKDTALRTSDIYVDAQDGTVVLSGTVGKSEDASRAVQIAYSVDDVKSVESRLAVRSGG